MENSNNRKRAELVSSILMDSQFTTVLATHPKRISNALGFCETGKEITSLIAIIFSNFREDKNCLMAFLQILNGVMEKIDERDLLR